MRTDYCIAVHNYGNLAPESAMHGIVFRFAQHCWVRNIRTFMTGELLSRIFYTSIQYWRRLASYRHRRRSEHSGQSNLCLYFKMLTDYP